MRTIKPLPTPQALDPLPPGTAPVIRHGECAVVYHIPTSLPLTLSQDETPSQESFGLKTTIVLPLHSAWTSGLHFHTTHTEYLHLKRGCIFVQLNDQTHLISAAAGGIWQRAGSIAPGLTIKVDRRVRHNWGRAQQYLRRRQIGARKESFPPDLDEEVIVEEWTSPCDISKPLFFWNLNGIIQSNALLLSEANQEQGSGGVPATLNEALPLSRAQKTLKSLLGAWWIDFQLCVVFWELDNYPVLISLPVDAIWSKSQVVDKISSAFECAVTYMVLLLASLVGHAVGIVAVNENRTPKELWRAWQKDGRMPKMVDSDKRR